MPKLLKPYLDFRGGLNVDSAPDSLADNELMEALNVTLDERGAASKRKGTAPLNQTPYGGQAESMIEWPKKDGTKLFLAVIGTTLCKINDDYTKTDIKALDAPDIGHFFYADKFYFTGKEGGTDKYWEYDGTTVAEVTPNVDATNDLAPIKRCRLFLWHTKSQRIFAAKDANDRSALYYSEAGDPTFFKGTSKLYPTTGDGPVYGLAPFGDAMVTLYQNSEWAWKGVNPSTDAEWVKLPSQYGTVAEKSIVLTPNSLTFLGTSGIISISLGLTDQNVVLITGDELVKNRCKNKVTSIIRSITKPEIACAVFDRTNDRFLLAYTDVKDATRNSKVLALDWALQSFTIYDGLQVNEFMQRADGVLLIATDGYILQAEQGYKDFDTATGEYKPIRYKVKTKRWNLDYPFNIKKTKRLLMAAKQYDTEVSSVDLTIQAGYKELSYPGISLDESFVWGEEWGKVWGWDDLATSEMKCNTKAQRFQVIMENNVIDQPVSIYGFGWEYQVKKAKGVKIDGKTD